MLFYTGTHVLGIAKHLERSFISVNILRKRKSDFTVNNWILDSGAFSEISIYGHYRFPVIKYARQVNRWAKCGNMELAVTQDYMCEPFIIKRTGLDVKTHQQLTIGRYDELMLLTDVPIMPVLQGYEPEEYLQHLDMYGERLKVGARVGVGSVCKRNSKPKQIATILEVIKCKRPDLKLHGFGLKTTALINNYICSLLYSADSLAWSYSARREGRDRNGTDEALAFTNKMERRSGTREHQFEWRI
jgi:hypothetical protein